MHFVDDLKRNSVPQNTSSGPGESQYKIACQQPAKNTQHIACQFEGQEGKQYTDNVVIDQAYAEIVLRDDVFQGWGSQDINGKLDQVDPAG